MPTTNPRPALVRGLSNHEIDTEWTLANKPPATRDMGRSAQRRFARACIAKATEEPAAWFRHDVVLGPSQTAYGAGLEIQGGGTYPCDFGKLNMGDRGTAYLLFVPDTTPTVSLNGDYTAEELRAKVAELEGE